MAAPSIIASAPIFYDFEASALNGCPIEIGWAYPEDGTVRCEGHLILPDPDWDIESSWDDGAQALHGISLKQLRAEGEPAFNIARRMNEVLAGRELFADSPFDIAWMNELFTAADLELTFHLRQMLAPVLIDRLRIDMGVSEADSRATADRVGAEFPQTHRAVADARHWAELWLAILQKDASR